jgi:oxygen-independent coproporphyrinogen-3 oxidase
MTKQKSNDIDFEQFVKYSKPGPRYTSYPTALEFKEVKEQFYIDNIKNSPKDKPLSLYLHLPFCKSACYFCGCNVIYTSKDEKKTRYIEYLKKELSLLSKHLDTNRLVTQMHFGGGTPTYFTPIQLDEISKLLKEYFPNFSDDAEISCEIDPRYFNSEHMQMLSANGFTRISFGVQDFDDKVQLAIQRVQSFELTKNAIKIARDAGIKSINIDLIYGLPYQTSESFANTLEKVMELDPDRLAIFNYAHVPWMKKTMRKIDETTLPKAVEKLEILKQTIDYLTKQNEYMMVGMDHFAKKDDELFTAISKGELHRNFQGYTTKGGSQLIGIGVTSIGNGVDYFSQNYKTLKEYEEALDSGRLPIYKGVSLSDDDIIRQNVIMELMSNFKVNIKRFEKKHKIDFNNYFKESICKLNEFEKEGILSISKDEIKVFATGTMLIRNIAMAFDAYLKNISKDEKKFSKTI